MNFYVTLPSNTNSDYFENTIANYKTKLASRLQLNGNWEVGLSSISYTRTWNNIIYDEIIKIAYYSSGKRWELQPFTLGSGMYYTIEDLINRINNVFETNAQTATRDREIQLPRLEIIEKENKKYVRIKLSIFRNTYVFPEFSYNLCRLLGINKKLLDDTCIAYFNKYIYEAEEFELNTDNSMQLYQPLKTPSDKYIDADSDFDLSDNYHTIFVYCDIIEPNYVGDTLSPLLRYVEIPTESKYGEQIFINYDNIQYLPVISNDLESIEIDLRDDAGEPITFQYGRTICVLHFRKMQ